MKVILVDDHAIVRDGLRAILEQSGITIVGECSNGREAVAMATQLRPDIVVMDVSMAEMNGIDATAQIVRSVPNCRVIGLSMHADRRYVAAMFAAGAFGYLLKDAAVSELLEALSAVSAGHTYTSAGVRDALGETLRRGTPPRGTPMLTSREREVLQLLAEGKTSKEIACRLDIAVPTVDTHRRQIMTKLEIRTIAGLTKFAVREGLTTA